MNFMNLDFNIKDTKYNLVDYEYRRGRRRRRRRNRCWKGYRPVRGKKPYSKGSCKKKFKDERLKF